MIENLPEETPKPKKVLEKVDTEKLAAGLRLQEQIREQSEPKTEYAPTKLTTICPRCKLLSLFYNQRDRVYECLNKWCPRKGPPTLSEGLTEHFLHGH